MRTSILTVQWRSEWCFHAMCCLIAQLPSNGQRIGNRAVPHAEQRERENPASAALLSSEYVQTIQWCSCLHEKGWLCIKTCQIVEKQSCCVYRAACYKLSSSGPLLITQLLSPDTEILHCTELSSSWWVYSSPGDAQLSAASHTQFSCSMLQLAGPIVKLWCFLRTSFLLMGSRLRKLGCLS